MSEIRSGIHAWFIGKYIIIKPRWWWRVEFNYWKGYTNEPH